MKMKHVLFALIALLAAPLAGQAGELPRNEQPMYGNAGRPAADQRTNDDIVAAAKKKGMNLNDASNMAVDVGWRALSQNDLPKAMRRFNQGWLFDPNNGRVYWGFAVVLQIRDRNLDGAIEMFDKARKLLPGDPALLVDYGRILEGAGRYHDAIEKFRAALALDEKIPPAYYGLVRAYLGLRDARNALRYARAGKPFGIPMSDDEIEQLQQFADKQKK